MNKLGKQYQLWTRGDSAYNITEFDTLEELLDDIATNCTQDFYITQKVNLKEIQVAP